MLSFNSGSSVDVAGINNFRLVVEVVSMLLVLITFV